MKAHISTWGDYQRGLVKWADERGYIVWRARWGASLSDDVLEAMVEDWGSPRWQRKAAAVRLAERAVKRDRRRDWANG